MGGRFLFRESKDQHVQRLPSGLRPGWEVSTSHLWDSPDRAGGLSLKDVVCVGGCFWAGGAQFFAHGNILAMKWEVCIDFSGEGNTCIKNYIKKITLRE